MIQPETQFASVGNDRVAYQVLGEGPRDLLWTTGYWSHLDIEWEDPGWARFFRRLASFSRLIRFDRRGAGLSDRRADDASSMADHWLQDCAAVLDAVGSTAPVIISATAADAGPLALQFVDRHPDHCSGLVFANTTACWAAKPDYAEGLSLDAVQRIKELFLQGWGKLEFAAGYAPSQVKNEAFMRWVAKYCRATASPRAMVENIGDELIQMDSRRLLRGIRVPSLVMARTQYQFVPIAQARYMAAHIPGARFVELPGSDHGLCWETPDQILDLIEEFVTGTCHGGEAERVAAAILFTDIVNSTRRATELGDAAWRALLDRHDQIVREQIAFYRGRLVETTGDGTLASFDSSNLAVQCALALRGPMAELGISIRAGLHFGEVELREDGRIGGVAVHIGARVMSLASADEVLVSRTVRDILLGSHFKFQDRGTHELKGVPDRWPVYALVERKRP